MNHNVDVIIIGAGSAGLAALKEVKKHTQKYLIIDHGPLGTTCARTGCMPSKALIQVANEIFQAEHVFKNHFATKAGRLNVNSEATLRHVRKLRDHFVAHAKKPVTHDPKHFIQGVARFTGPNQISVGIHHITAKKIILATGTSPIIPDDWKKFKNRMLTSESIFEQKSLPSSLGVIGAGPLGLELGQALARLGVHVECFSKDKRIGGLTDPQVQKCAIKIFRRELKMHIGVQAKPEAYKGKIAFRVGGQMKVVESLLVSIGRSANTNNMGLEDIGVVLNEKGIPHFDKHTLQIKGVPIFIAGDVTGDRLVLHEAAFEGRAAGYNACRPARKFKRYTPFYITFTEPNIAIVGESYKSLQGKDISIGEVSFENQGRSLILGENRGLLRIYAQKKTKRILGAEMICPEAEHLAHLLVFAIEQKLSAHQLLKMPFYHPTVEEGLRTALRSLVR
jgi:dihydrolipoamide dehydrogenase